jgi:hypothetical protein
MRALRKLGEEEDEDLSSGEAEADSDDEPQPARQAAAADGKHDSSSEAASEDEAEDEEEDTDWERFFEVVESKAGRPLWVSKLLGTRFTEAEAARDFTTGKKHRRAVVEARRRLLTYNEKQELAAKAEARKEKRRVKALAKTKAKAIAKRKATECVLAASREPRVPRSVRRAQSLTRALSAGVPRVQMRPQSCTGGDRAPQS